MYIILINQAHVHASTLEIYRYTHTYTGLCEKNITKWSPEQNGQYYKLDFQIHFLNDIFIFRLIFSQQIVLAVAPIQDKQVIND